MKRFFQPSSTWRAISTNRDLLRSGLFLYAGGSTYRHWRQPLPEHVRATKARRVSFFKPKLTLQERFRHLRKSARTILKPRFFWADGTGRYSFPIIIGGANNGECVLLDPVRGQTARTLPPGLWNLDQARLREQWSTYIPSPGFKVCEGGRLLLEDYVNGCHLAALDPVAQKDAYRKIIRLHADLVRYGKLREEPRGALEKTLSKSVVAGLEKPLRRRLQHSNLLSDARGWPLVPAFPDSSPGNIVMVDRARPVFIDALPLIPTLFFYAPVFLVSRGQSVPQLRKSFFSGDFDRDFSELFEAAGIDYVPSRDFREELAVLSLLLRPLRSIVREPERFDAVFYSKKVNWFFKQSGLRTSALPI